MRRILRSPLDAATQSALEAKQHAADRKRVAGNLKVDTQWDAARKTVPLRKVLTILKRMTGDRERCMYCMDSHGTDIEHFWPKTPYPERMFSWPNLLLCCTECGRFKGNVFPLENGEPLLIDPTVEDPWRHLDFDPVTGNLVARFEAERNDWSPKGQKTVELLQLDRREALAAGYQRTYRRLARLVERFLASASSGTAHLPEELLNADDHGLLGWCLEGPGQVLPPFVTLRDRHPAVWMACLDVFHAEYA